MQFNKKLILYLILGIFLGSVIGGLCVGFITMHFTSTIFSESFIIGETHASYVSV